MSEGLVVPSRMVLVEYYLTTDQVMIFLVDGSLPTPQLMTVPVEQQRLEEHVRALIDQLAHLGQGRADASAAVDRTLADSPLAALVEPVLKWAPAGTIVCLVPHGILHRVPLHAIPVAGQRLCDTHPVVYSPSASVLRYCQANRHTQRRADALVLAAPAGPRPLSFAQAHVATLQQGFECEVLRAQDADRAALLRRFGNGEGSSPPAILHIDAHGAFDPVDSMQSGVELADTRLTAKDMLSLRLTGSLVTLAACSSGVSDVRPGDELLGVIRALLYAGAPNVLVSLWDVDELSTAMMLDHFYSELSNDEPAALALTAAQRWLRRRTAAEVCAFAAQVRAQVACDDPAAARLALAEARIRLSAQDLQAAIAAAETALGAAADDAVRSAAEDVRDVARFLRPAVQSPNLTRQVYAHPFFWAPFVLVGDWR